MMSAVLFALLLFDSNKNSFFDDWKTIGLNIGNKDCMYEFIKSNKYKT